MAGDEGNRWAYRSLHTLFPALMSTDTQTATKDEFYETIRAPMFYDFCEAESSEQLDCFFENAPYPDSSEESDEKEFECGILQDEEFDAKTPPKPVSRTRLTTQTKKSGLRSVKKSLPRSSKLEGRRASMAKRKAAGVRKTAMRPAARPTTTQRPSVQVKPARKTASKPSIRPSMVKSTAKPSVPSATRPSVRPSVRSSVRPSIARTSVKPTTTTTTKEEKQFVFRARPLDRRVFESCGDRGVPKLAKLPLTRPVSPKLATNHRQRKAAQAKTSSKLTTTTKPSTATVRPSVTHVPSKRVAMTKKPAIRPMTKTKTVPVKSQSTQVVAKKIVPVQKRAKSMENQENENGVRKSVRPTRPATKRSALTARS